MHPDNLVAMVMRAQVPMLRADLPVRHMPRGGRRRGARYAMGHADDLRALRQRAVLLEKRAMRGVRTQHDQVSGPPLAGVHNACWLLQWRFVRVRHRLHMASFVKG